MRNTTTPGVEVTPEVDTTTHGAVAPRAAIILGDRILRLPMIIPGEVVDILLQPTITRGAAVTILPPMITHGAVVTIQTPTITRGAVEIPVPRKRMSQETLRTR